MVIVDRGVPTGPCRLATALANLLRWPASVALANLLRWPTFVALANVLRWPASVALADPPLLVASCCCSF